MTIASVTLISEWEWLKVKDILGRLGSLGIQESIGVGRHVCEHGIESQGFNEG